MQSISVTFWDNMILSLFWGHLSVLFNKEIISEVNHIWYLIIVLLQLSTKFTSKIRIDLLITSFKTNYILILFGLLLHFLILRLSLKNVILDILYFEIQSTYLLILSDHLLLCIYHTQIIFTDFHDSRVLKFYWMPIIHILTKVQHCIQRLI